MLRSYFSDCCYVKAVLWYLILLSPKLRSVGVELVAFFILHSPFGTVFFWKPPNFTAESTQLQTSRQSVGRVPWATYYSNGKRVGLSPKQDPLQLFLICVAGARTRTYRRTDFNPKEVIPTMVTVRYQCQFVPTKVYVKEEA